MLCDNNLTEGMKKCQAKKSGPSERKLQVKKRLKKSKWSKKTNISREEVQRNIDQVRKLAKRKCPTTPKNRRGKIRIASDCTGLGSDIIALSQCRLLEKVEGVSWSDNDSSKRKMYRTVCYQLGHLKVGEVCEDMAQRNFAMAVSDCAKDTKKQVAIDLYIAGYPCPSFSALGKKKGALDLRGLVTLHGLKFIAAKRPRVCILENVRGLVSKKHKEVTDLMREIFTDMGYKVFLKALNSKEFGLPQSRPRVYIVAIQEDSMKKKFCWPKSWKLPKGSLKKFLDISDRSDEVVPIPNYEAKYGQDVWQKGYILDVDSSERFQSAQLGVCPCLTRSRLGSSTCGYYIPKLRRRLNVVEAGRLQGVPKKITKILVAATSDQQVRKALGDGMSINVLGKVILACLESIGAIQSAKEIDHGSQVSEGSDSVAHQGKMSFCTCELRLVAAHD